MWHHLESSMTSQTGVTSSVDRQNGNFSVSLTRERKGMVERSMQQRSENCACSRVWLLVRDRLFLILIPGHARSWSLFVIHIRVHRSSFACRFSGMTWPFHIYRQVPVHFRHVFAMWVTGFSFFTAGLCSVYTVIDSLMYPIACASVGSFCSSSGKYRKYTQRYLTIHFACYDWRCNQFDSAMPLNNFSHCLSLCS